MKDIKNNITKYPNKDNELLHRIEKFLDDCSKELPYNEYIEIINELKDVCENRLLELSKK